MTGKSSEVASCIQCCDSGFWEKKLFVFEKKKCLKLVYFRNVSLWFTQPLKVHSDFSLPLAHAVSAPIAMLKYGTYTIKGLQYILYRWCLTFFCLFFIWDPKHWDVTFFRYSRCKKLIKTGQFWAKVCLQGSAGYK